MSELKKDISYLDIYIQRIGKYCNDQESNYFGIGYNLNELKRTPSYLLEAGYKNIYEFADKEFKIKRSTTHYLIQIIEKFAVKTPTGFNFTIQEAYRDYKYSQLRLLSSIDPDSHQYFKPSMTIKEMEDLKKFLELDEDKKKEDADLEVETEEQPESKAINSNEIRIVISWIESLKIMINNQRAYDTYDSRCKKQIKQQVDTIMDRLNELVKKAGG